jgi:hypothetical protein
MFRRKTVLAQGLWEEKSVYDSLNKLIAAQTRVSEQQLRWAKTEDNPLFLCLFGRLAELSWMGNELLKQFQEKHNELNRVFKDIDQEERIVEESRKALLACKAKFFKLQKQMEHSKRKNDTAKVQSLEVELTTQGSLHDHLRESVDTQSQKLELYKVHLLKTSLQAQAQTYLEITINYQALFNAQLQLADMLPASSPDSPQEELEMKVPEEMKLLLSQVTESLHLYPPANGGINIKKLSESVQSPPFHHRSSTEEVLAKTSRGKTQHSISQPVLVGHSQTAPTEDAAQVQNISRLPPRHSPLEEATVTSGEYCEIDLNPGALDDSDGKHKYNVRRSPCGISRTQSGNTVLKTNQGSGDQKQWQKPKNILKSHEQYHSSDSIVNEASAIASGTSCSSAEDLNSEKEKPQEMTPPETRGSDECYADPVDAIHEFLQSNNSSVAVGAAACDGPNKITAEFTSAAESLLRSTDDEHAQQPSKEQQLQLFHERLFKDTSAAESDRGGGELDFARNEALKFAEVEDEPMYSNPFDALSGNSTKPFRVRKRNVSSPTPLRQQTGSSPPPPPLPSKDLPPPRRPVRYCRHESGDSEGGSLSPGSNASVSPIQQKIHAWDRREPVRKLKNSSSKGCVDDCFSPTPGASGGEKPQAPLSVAQRLLQLRQRSQSDGVTLDEARFHSRPPMPLPIPEQEAAELNEQEHTQLNGQAHHPMDGEVASTDTGNSWNRTGWLERTGSDQQPVRYARRGMAQVVPLSAQEIVQQHISHVV